MTSTAGHSCEWPAVAFFCAGAFCPTAATTSRRHNFRFVLRSPILLVVWLATIAVAGCARIGLPWSSGSEGSWIGLCADSLATPTARKRVPVTGDSGKRQALVIGDSAITGCTGTPIALGEHAVLWAGLSSGPNTEGVDLIGRDRNGAFDVDEQISLPAPPEPAEAGGPDPTRWRAFGAESRATATVANGSWSLSCSPGTPPAGAVLRLKDVVRGDTVLRLEYTARGTFELLAADSAMNAASVRGLDTLKLEPIPTANALAVQSIFVNDHRVDGVPPTVTIAPGDSLRGTAYLRYSTDSPAVLFTLAQTATWNVASQDTLTVRTLNAGVRDARDAVSFAVRGPAKPGAYWLLWTQSAEPAAVWLLSGTNWSCHTPVWDDGNDLATQPDTAVAAGVRSGEIWIKFIYCTPTSRSAAMRQLLIAGMRVVVRPR